MRVGFLSHSILQVGRCNIQPFLCHRSPLVSCSWSRSVVLLPCKSTGSGFRLLESNGFERWHGVIPISRAISTSNERIVRSAASCRVRHEFLDGSLKAIRTSSKPVLLNRFTSIKLSDAEQKIFWAQNFEPLVNVFAIDLETTGLDRKEGRIIEIGIRDLSGGKNSCFQTLVNPEQYVSNSSIHGITTSMVNHPDVPRIKDVIPILMQYIANRQVSGGICLFVAHNARSFDIPFLINAFRQRSMEVPSDWLFLDTLALARELKKTKKKRFNGNEAAAVKLPLKITLQGLRQFYEIPQVASAHRAMADVNLLIDIFERLTSDLKFTMNDLLARAFKASDVIFSKEK